MACCFKSKELHELDPVKFFIVTEMIRAEQEVQRRERDHHQLEAMEQVFGFEQLKVA